MTTARSPQANLAVEYGMHALDNPIWKALTTAQAHLAQAAGAARKFPPEITPLGGFPEPNEESYDSLAELLGKQPAVGVFYDSPPIVPAGWTIFQGGPLLQMIHEDGAEGAGLVSPIPGFVELNAADVPEMVALAELTKPGPFSTRTYELGGFVGIRREGRLAAMAGERLRAPGYTEVSAVCTHPDFLGRGYAAFLMQTVMERIRGRGETPFLHVRAENARAIALYERLGFRTRVQLHYAVVRKPEAGLPLGTPRETASRE
jgi:ribosomal protein S18 acetylase RimI-like enzyme